MSPEFEVVQFRRPNKLVSALILVAVIVIVVSILAFVSIVYISGDQAGIIEKKFGGGKIPAGRIYAVDGENGIQARVLEPGWHLWYFPWQYNIRKVPLVEVREGFVGLVQANDGISLPADTIYAPEWADPDKMQDAQYFLGEGNGNKGPQLTVSKPGTYRINTEVYTVTSASITDFKTGEVAVVKSNVGERVAEPIESDSGDPFEPQRLVKVGQRGIWKTALAEGQYYLHTKAYEVTLIDTRQVKVSYTQEKEAGERTVNQPMKSINVRSSDGYTFPVDVRITYQIKGGDAPKVVATVGDADMVLDKLVTPKTRDIFRNNGEKVKALDYVQNRSEQGKQSALMLRESLVKYGITILEVSIGDVGNEETLGALLKTQTDREIALQEQETFAEQQRAAEKKKELTKTEQEAEEEKKLAIAAYGVQVAEEEKKKVVIEAEAEAEQIKLLAEAKAEAYKKIAEVIGEQNAALIEIMKIVAQDNIKITPEVMVGGSEGKMTDALMGTILRGKIGSDTGAVK